jgi:hypothetical protein
MMCAAGEWMTVRDARAVQKMWIAVRGWCMDDGAREEGEGVCKARGVDCSARLVNG